MTNILHVVLMVSQNGENKMITRDPQNKQITLFAALSEAKEACEIRSKAWPTNKYMVFSLVPRN